MRICSVEGCENKAVCRSWCEKHYSRWKRHRDITDPPTREEHFWLDVDKSKDCWRWRNSHSHLGYALVMWFGKTRPAHRIAYELTRGPIPDGLVIDHLCRNRWCLNPDHMEPVTQRENVLRGEGVAARHAAKTHCPQGHEYTEENTYHWPGAKGASRACRACISERYQNRAVTY